MILNATLVVSIGVYCGWRGVGRAAAYRVSPTHQIGQHRHMAANRLSSGNTCLRACPILQGHQLEQQQPFSLDSGDLVPRLLLHVHGESAQELQIYSLY